MSALLCLTALCCGAAAQKHDAKRATKAKSGPTEKRQQARLTAARLEYRARARKLAKDDVVGHFALARWCADKKLPRCARWELHEVLREAPDHVGARAMLGQVFHDGKWVARDVAMQAKGLVNVDGKWLRKYDAARYQHRLRVQHEANVLFARLADRSRRTRAAARHGLEALAEKEKMPELAKLARRKAAEYDAYWRARRGSYTAYTGLLTVNATHSKLESLEPFTTSLGTGAPVRLHLPRMKTISVGTTVAVPLGIGR